MGSHAAFIMFAIVYVLTIGVSKSLASKDTQSSNMAQRQLVLQISDEHTAPQSRVLGVAEKMLKTYGQEKMI